MNKTTTAESLPMNLRAARKIREGIVVSGKADKTRIIEVSWNIKHPRYHKILRRSNRLYAHDEKNESHAGDRVELFETRPMSRSKRWRISRVLERTAI